MTIIKKFDPEKGQKKFSKKYLVFAFIGLFILTLAEIWAANTVVNFGEKFAEIASLKQSIVLENHVLENEIAKYTSLSTVASESAKLGFLKPSSIQYIR